MNDKQATLNDINGTDKDFKKGHTKPTQLHQIINDWEKNSLAEVAKADEDSFVEGPSGSSLKSEEFYDEGHARIIKLQHIGEGVFKDKNKKYITKSKFEELSHHSAAPDDIVIAAMAEPIARACLLPNSSENYILAAMADCIKLEPNDDFNDLFVMYSLNSYPVWKQAYSLARGTARKRINLNELKRVEIPSPPIQEQRKIVTVLNNIDDAIEKSDSIIKQAAKIKKGISQSIFTEGYYNHEAQSDSDWLWSEIPADWDFLDLTDVANINPSYSTELEEVDYIEMSALDTMFPSPKYIDKRNPQDYSGRMFSEGDTLFARITPCTENGKIGFVDNLSTPVGIGSTEFVVISPNEEKVLPKFIYHYTRTHEVRDYAISRMRGSTGRQRVPFDVFRNELSIPVPEISEQVEIIDILDNYDQLAQLYEQKKSIFKQIKKGLMQDLLSGKVRTTDTNIEVPEHIMQHG